MLLCWSVWVQWPPAGSPGWLPVMPVSAESSDSNASARSEPLVLSVQSSTDTVISVFNTLQPSSPQSQLATHGRRKKVMSTATAQACQTWPLASCSSLSACACLRDDSAGSGSASKQAWLSLAKVMSRSIRFWLRVRKFGPAQVSDLSENRRSGRGPSGTALDYLTTLNSTDHHTSVRHKAQARALQGHGLCLRGIHSASVLA